MDAEEIRKIDIEIEAGVGYETASLIADATRNLLLREIAAQLAEISFQLLKRGPDGPRTP